MKTRLGQCATLWLFRTIVICLLAFAPSISAAAPYAAFVVDARTGKVLHASNADTRLHPASLTKMMTLYITFEAIKKGEITSTLVQRIQGKAKDANEVEEQVVEAVNAFTEPPSPVGRAARPGCMPWRC